MAKLFMRRVGQSLVPDGDDSIAEFENIPFGKPLMAEVTQPRSLQRLRLYWAIVGKVAAGTGRTKEVVDEFLKLETGHFEQWYSQKFGWRMRAKSIAFPNFDELGFKQFFDRAILAIYEEYGIERSDILEGIDKMLIPTEQRT